MLMRETKITADHLKRDAYLYVRQSSPRQVTEHNESTQRQYALRNRAIGLDPDAEVQKALQLVFDTFERTGSAMETVRYFLQQGLLFPRRLRIGPNKGDLLWAPPRHARVLQVLHNPRCAGAFVYGRTRTRHMPDGSTRAVKVARADWQFVMPGNDDAERLPAMPPVDGRHGDHARHSW